MSDEWPKCVHREERKRVTNQEHYSGSGPHRSTYVCGRRDCIDDAIRWVEAGTGEKAVVIPLATPEEEPQDRDGHTCPCPHPVGHPACGCGSPEGEKP